MAADHKQIKSESDAKTHGNLHHTWTRLTGKLESKANKVKHMLWNLVDGGRGTPAPQPKEACRFLVVPCGHLALRPRYTDTLGTGQVTCLPLTSPPSHVGEVDLALPAERSPGHGMQATSQHPRLCGPSIRYMSGTYVGLHGFPRRARLFGCRVPDDPQSFPVITCKYTTSDSHRGAATNLARLASRFCEQAPLLPWGSFTQACHYVFLVASRGHVPSLPFPPFRLGTRSISQWRLTLDSETAGECLFAC